MKLIIAGSRRLIIPIATVELAVKHFNLNITEVVCGMATGVDTAGLYWARARKIPVQPFPAHWEDLKAPNARIVQRADGTQYNGNAGPERNAKMAGYADALLVILKEWTSGTKDMNMRMLMYRKPVYLYWMEVT